MFLDGHGSNHEMGRSSGGVWMKKGLLDDQIPLFHVHRET
jgi:hypothetical protein